MRIRRRPAFVEDLAEAYLYLSERNPALADRLIDEVEAIIEPIAAFPDIGRAREELRRGVRSLRLRRFRYVLFYRRDADEVVLLRLLHGARDIRAELIEG